MSRLTPTVALCAAGLLVPAAANAQRVQRLVFAEVVDRIGATIPGVTAEEFQLYESGIKRTVTRATLGGGPMRIVLFVDSSSIISPQLPQLRAGLTAFVDAMPPEPEIAFLTTGSQLRVRVPPTVDRQRVRSAVAGFATDGGANSFLDSMLEADQRFLKSAPGTWGVFVILTTDAGESRGEANISGFNKFVDDFLARGGSAHGIVVQAKNSGLPTMLAMNLVQNAGGIYESLAISNALPDRMTAIAQRIIDRRKAMAGRYELEYTSDAKTPQKDIDVRVAREGATIRLSGRR